MGSNSGYDDDLTPTRRLPALDPWGRRVDQLQGSSEAAHPSGPTQPAPAYQEPSYQAPPYPSPPSVAPQYTPPSAAPQYTAPAAWGPALSQAPAPPAYGPPVPAFAPPGPDDMPVAPGAPAPAWWPPAPSAPPPRPATHVAGAALATVLLCWPLGAVALANALRVDDLWRAGDLTGARRASNRARAWTVWAVVVGVVWLTFWAGVALALR